MFEVGFAVVFAVVLGAYLFWGDGVIDGRRDELIEGGDWEGLFAGVGLEVVPSEEDGKPARAVGLDGRFEVALPCASIADATPEMTMCFRLDLSEWVDPGLSMLKPSFEFDPERQLHRDAPVSEGMRASLLDVQGDLVGVLCLSTTPLAWNVREFLAIVHVPTTELSLRGGVFTYQPEKATFFLEGHGHRSLERICALMRSLDEMMSRRKGEAEELALVVCDDGRPLYTRVDAACMLHERHAGAAGAQAEEALAQLFTERPRADALRRVIASGWAPSPELTRRLAASGDHASRSVLMGFIEGCPDVVAYAAALLTLRDADIPGAAEIVDALDVHATHGGLSLAEDDAARGGLSQAVERGGLSDAEG